MILKKKKFVRSYLKFPHIWVLLVISFLMVVSLCVSVYLDIKSIAFWSSIFANVFAGLLTGLVVCLISAVKQIYIFKLETKKVFLEELKHKVLDYSKFYNELRAKKFVVYDGDEELFDFIYDTASRANWINDYILQGSYDKNLSFDPRVFCKNKFTYDATLLINDFSVLHDNVYSIGINRPTKKEILEYFEKVDKLIKKLNHSLTYELNDIESKLNSLNRIL